MTWAWCIQLKRWHILAVAGNLRCCCVISLSLNFRISKCLCHYCARIFTGTVGEYFKLFWLGSVKCWISHRKQLRTYSKSWDQFYVLVGADHDSREAPCFKLSVSSSTPKCFCTIIWVTWMFRARACLSRSSPCETWVKIYLWRFKCDFETKKL